MHRHFTGLMGTKGMNRAIFTSITSSFNFFPLADNKAAVPSGLSNSGGDSPILGIRTLLFPPPATGLFLCAYAPAFPADNGTMCCKVEVKDYMSPASVYQEDETYPTITFTKRWEVRFLQAQFGKASKQHRWR